MPGRTPHEAFEAFIGPLQDAVSCLGSAKIAPSAGGRTDPVKVHAWALNGVSGMHFTGGWYFEAQMHYSLVQAAFSQTWRVKTHGYRYQLALQGSPLWRIHWHPTLTSGYNLPHLHLNLGPPGVVPGDTMKQHQPTGRMTFEDAVTWVFNAGIKPARDDWQEVLAETRANHVRHRTWSTDPPAP